MAQGQDLEVQRDSGAHQPAERQEQPNQHGWHREESLSVTAGKFNGANEYGLYSRHSSRQWRYTFSPLPPLSAKIPYVIQVRQDEGAS
jgi:hypothetical protein